MKHPQNRQERLAINAKKKRKKVASRDDVTGEHDGLDSAVPLSDEGS